MSLGIWIGALLISSVAHAGWKQELREIKEACEEGLLTAQECAAERKEVLARRDAALRDGEVDWFCSYGGTESEPATLSGTSNKFSESADAAAVVREIIDESGLVPNFVVTAANVANAQAEVRGGRRYIRYNRQFLDGAKRGTGTNWAVYSVMAHEIAHHLQGHTIQAGGSRPPLELEADEWSGWILAKLGANLQQAQSFWLQHPHAPGSATHPPARERIAAIKKGWNRANKKPSPEPVPEPDPPSPRPRPGPKPMPPPSPVTVARCIVQGQSVIIKSDNIVYDARTHRVEGRRGPATLNGCAYMLYGTSGSAYCVNAIGQVYSPVFPQPVGMCQGG